MSPKKEETAEPVSAPLYGIHSGTNTELPKGWLYHRPGIGSWKLPYFASPIIQLCYVALIFFLCPGMYNALSGLGGGGQLDATVSNNATVALYSTFATVAFFSGTVCNKLGVRITLGLGCFGYVLYISSFLCYNHTKNAGFVIAAGAILGASAALLWAAESVIMISYPPENKRGRYIGIFWMIFNLGAVIGSLVPLLQNVHSTSSSSVGDGTYTAFLALTALGTVLALMICNAQNIIRGDGSRVILVQQPTWKSEFMGLLKVLKSDKYIVTLFPMFLASNWFYTYQFNDFNLARFDVRTRSLNSLMYWCAQIIGACIWGALLDLQTFSRKTRARAGLFALFAITMSLWGGGYYFQKSYDRESASIESSKIDWTSPTYGGPAVLYVFYGCFDSIWQTYIYWTLGAISNDSRKLAILAGFYKAMQSTGAAIIFRIDALEVPYMDIFASSWILCAASLVCAAPVIWFKVTDHTEQEDDVIFSDALEKENQVEAQVL
ncbi:major facilitator superfamily domain-containing protein [Xylariales sp. PMI_506]|nr:major facilitator superfamily domain-containing protein [Xylariales sp. PMI_506]